MSRAPVGVGLLGAVCQLVVAPPARADERDISSARPKTAQLVFSRGDLSRCPDEAAMKKTVSARLGYDPFEANAMQIVTATISRGTAGLRGHVALRDRAFEVRGSRVLTTASDDCAELASAMALAISIAIDPLSVTRPEQPQDAAPPLAGTAASPPVPAFSTPPSPHERDHEHEAIRSSPLAGPRVRLRVGADASIAFGATPGTSLAPGAYLGVSYERWSVDLQGRGYFESSADAPKGSVRATLLLASIVPCFHASIAFGCALVGVGSLAGKGSGVDVPQTDASLYVNTGARLGIEVRALGPFALCLHGEALVPLVSTSLFLRGVEVWSTPSVTAGTGLGLLAHFP